jgi:hypothetical protein
MISRISLPGVAQFTLGASAHPGVRAASHSASLQPTVSSTPQASSLILRAESQSISTTNRVAVSRSPCAANRKPAQKLNKPI